MKGLNEKQRRILEDIRDAYRRGEDAAVAMERISRRHGVEPEVMVGLLFSEELMPSTEKADEPETVLMVGHEIPEGFRSFAIEVDEGLRELPVFTEPAKASRALEDMGYNPEMVRLEVPMEKLGTVEVPFAEAMRMAGALGCAYVGVDVVFGDVPYRRFPVSPSSG